MKHLHSRTARRSAPRPFTWSITPAQPRVGREPPLPPLALDGCYQCDAGCSSPPVARRGSRRTG